MKQRKFKLNSFFFPLFLSIVSLLGCAGGGTVGTSQIRTSRITGTLVDDQDRPIQGITVTILESGDSGVTDTEGKFEIVSDLEKDQSGDFPATLLFEGSYLGEPLQDRLTLDKLQQNEGGYVLSLSVTRESPSSGLVIVTETVEKLPDDLKPNASNPVPTPTPTAPPQISNVEGGITPVPILPTATPTPGSGGTFAPSDIQPTPTPRPASGGWAVNLTPTPTPIPPTPTPKVSLVRVQIVWGSDAYISDRQVTVSQGNSTIFSGKSDSLGTLTGTGILRKSPLTVTINDEFIGSSVSLQFEDIPSSLDIRLELKNNNTDPLGENKFNLEILEVVPTF